MRKERVSASAHHPSSVCGSIGAKGGIPDEPHAVSGRPSPLCRAPGSASAKSLIPQPPPASATAPQQGPPQPLHSFLTNTLPTASERAYPYARPRSAVDMSSSLGRRGLCARGMKTCKCRGGYDPQSNPAARGAQGCIAKRVNNVVTAARGGGGGHSRAATSRQRTTTDAAEEAARPVCRVLCCPRGGFSRFRQKTSSQQRPLKPPTPPHPAAPTRPSSLPLMLPGSSWWSCWCRCCPSHPSHCWWWHLSPPPSRWSWLLLTPFFLASSRRPPSFSEESPERPRTHRLLSRRVVEILVSEAVEEAVRVVVDIRLRVAADGGLGHSARRWRLGGRCGGAVRQLQPGWRPQRGARPSRRPAPVACFECGSAGSPLRWAGGVVKPLTIRAHAPALGRTGLSRPSGPRGTTAGRC